MQIKTSINRLHKFVGRLTEYNAELRNQINTLCQPVAIQVTCGLKKLPIDPTANSKKVIDLLGNVYQVSSTICEIKGKIQKANAQYGISELLIEQQQQSFSRTLVMHMRNLTDRNTYLDVDSIEAMRDGMTMENDPLHLHLRGIDNVLVGKLEGIAQEYTTRINEISDRVSDLNRNEVTVEIPDALLPIVGITGK